MKTQRRQAMPRGTRLEEARSQLAERLRARREGIEQAVLARISAIADPDEANDPTYVASLRTAVSTALEHGVDGIHRGDDAKSIPPSLLAQARIAAGNGVSLETVLRRYFAGYALLGDFLVEEAGAAGLDDAALKRVLRLKATLFDRLLEAVAKEYTSEAESRLDTSERRRAERIQRLLDGELLDPIALEPELAYPFEAVHVGLIATGSAAAEAIRAAAATLDQRLLMLHRPEGVIWAWIGSRHGVDVEQLKAAVSSHLDSHLALAFGEPGRDLSGWRLTHQQARAASAVALSGGESVVRYVDSALLASMLQDEVLTVSLRGLYLTPLEHERDGGETAKRTLRAYFAANRNTSSAAAALGVSRRTVTYRLRSVEETLGRQLAEIAPELEAAIRLDDMGHRRG